ncbi:hypothetical protein [Engelhardtia mirabilis]|uniref:Glycosyltransferase RgtA/B/C/D-like domain-containing protein n=1 Tax=Engelhardtia mirabilis TaxID=2528011 RepID=A0A518BJW2_9BACT|nr:hypothetical protein Pla133_23390 [Planctomycetes bacterium Pla133]QDV01586.1 hypothetical protein Pla86_23380 [Planctomycetes bacterium Pla86]
MPASPPSPDDSKATGPASPDDSRPIFWLTAGAVLLTVVVRGLVAWSRLDEVELERYSATFAWALLNGVELNPERLPIIAHLRGSVVFGLLLVPLLAVGGPTLVMVKTLAVGFSGLSAGLVAYLSGRHLGLLAGITAALLLAFGPPAFQMVDVLALGSHADTIPFVLAPLAVILAGRPGTPLSTKAHLALGLLIGAGLFFSMQVWVAAPAVAAAWWCRDRRFLLNWRLALAALTAAPLIALIPVVTRSATVVNKPMASRFEDGGPLAMAGKLAEAVTVDLPGSWLYVQFGASWAGWLLTLACAAAGLYALIGFPWSKLLPRRPHPSTDQALVLYSLLHVAALLGAYSITDFRVNIDAWLDGMGSRYFFPILPALLFLVANLVRSLPRAAAIGTTCVLSVGGIAGVAPLIHLGVGSSQPPILATEFGLFLDHLAYSEPDDLDRRLALVDRVDPDWAEVRPMMHIETFAPPERVTPASLPKLLAHVARHSPEVAEFELCVIGFYGTQGAAENGPSAAMKDVGKRISDFLVSSVELMEPRDAIWFLRGAGRQLTQQQGAYLKRLEVGRPDLDAALAARAGFEFVTKLPAPMRMSIVEGMGCQLGRRATPYERLLFTILECSDSLPPQLYERYFVAFGWGVRTRFVEASFDPDVHLTLESILPAKALAPYRVGLAWKGPLDGEGR